MPDKTYILRFKPREPSMRAIVAATAGIYGDHLILLNSEGLLAALPERALVARVTQRAPLFVSETVESWNELGV